MRASDLTVPRLAFLLLAGACLLAAPASADRGVAVDLGKVEITDGLLAGGRYRLPAFGVRNPGDERTSYRMVVSYMTDQEGLEPPQAWFRFEPAEFVLSPGKTRSVSARIELPTGADPGDYEALLAAQIVTEEQGVQIGGAAASRVSFTIEPSSTLEAYWLKIRRFLTGHAPYTWAVPLAFALLAAGWTLRRRFSFTVARRA
jgi:hypothetical protein